MLALVFPSRAIANAVANAAALSTLNDAALSEGALVFVKTFRDWFVLRPASVETVNGVTVLATLSGVGRWERMRWAHPSWLRQPMWFVDATNGHDENTGIDDTHAIKTNAELMRRWGGPVVEVTSSITLTYLTATPASDPLNGRVVVAAGGAFAMASVPTVVRSSTFTAVTAINRATAQPLHVTDGAVDWTADVGRQLVISAGARVGMRAWVAKNMGAGVGRLSPLTLCPTVDYGSPTLATPVVGDAYQVRTLPSVYVGTFEIVAGTGDIPGSVSTCSVSDLGFNGGYGVRGTFRISGTMGQVRGCLFASVRVASDRACTFSSCKFDGTTLGGVQIFAGLSVSNGIYLDGREGGLTSLMDMDHLCQATRATVYGGALIFGTICVMDALSTGFVLDFFSSVQGTPAYLGVCSLWGSAGTFGVDIKPGCSYRASAAPVINAGLGLGRELRVGATSKLYADMPYADAATQAYAVIG